MRIALPLLSLLLATIALAMPVSLGFALVRSHGSRPSVSARASAPTTVSQGHRMQTA